MPEPQGYPQTLTAARIAELSREVARLGYTLDETRADLAQSVQTAASFADAWKAEALAHQRTRERLALLEASLYDDGSRTEGQGMADNPFPTEVA